MLALGSLGDQVDDALVVRRPFDRRELLVARQLALLGDDLVGQLEVVEGADLAGTYQGDSHAALACSAGSSGAVDVDLGRLGEGVVDDVREVADVDAARGHVGRYQVVDLAGAHARHRALALVLGQVAGDSPRVVAVALQELGHGVGVIFGVAEDQRRLGFGGDQDLEEVAGSAHAADHVVVVVDLGHADVIVGGERDGLGLAHVAAGDAANLRGNGRREQQGLPIFARRQGVDDLVDLFLKAHRQHLVTLVEDEETDVVGAQVAAADVVEDPSGGAGDDLRTSSEGIDLGLHRCSTIDGYDLESLGLGDLRQLLGDLDGELAGRSEDEHLRPQARGVDALGDGDTKSGGLAGAGAGLDHEVLAGDDLVVDRGLDLHRAFVAHVREALQDIVIEVHVVEAGGVGFRLGVCLFAIGAGGVDLRRGVCLGAGGFAIGAGGVVGVGRGRVFLGDGQLGAVTGFRIRRRGGRSGLICHVCNPMYFIGVARPSRSVRRPRRGR